MATTTRSARPSRTPSQATLFKDESTPLPAPEVSENAREELRRVIIASGRQKGVGIHVFGVSSGETRISRALTPRGSSDWAAFDIDDVLDALAYLREEVGEKPVADFLAWVNGFFGYEPRKIETRSIEERLAILEEEAAEDAKLEAALERRKQRRRMATASARREIERAKDGVR